MATPGQLQMYNKMEISEMFSLDHRARDDRIGQIRRIHIYPDEKVPDAAIFKIWLEDHTLGNILRMELLRNENVLFAGYKVPHPLDHMIELRVQTLPKSSPQTALRIAIRNLRGECQSILQQFDKGVAALMKGEKHLPEIQDVRREKEGQLEMDTQSSGHDVAGATSDDARRPDAPMDEDFQNELDQLKRLETFGQEEGYSPAYSPESPHRREGGAAAAPVSPEPGSTPGLTPGPSPGVTPGLTPGATPGMTPGLTPGATPGPDGDVDMD